MTFYGGSGWLLGCLCESRCAGSKPSEGEAAQARSHRRVGYYLKGRQAGLGIALKAGRQGKAEKAGRRWLVASLPYSLFSGLSLVSSPKCFFSRTLATKTSCYPLSLSTIFKRQTVKEAAAVFIAPLSPAGLSLAHPLIACCTHPPET